MGSLLPLQPASLGLLHIIYSGNSLCPPLSSSTIISCHNILFFLSASIIVLLAFVCVFDLQSDFPSDCKLSEGRGVSCSSGYTMSTSLGRVLPEYLMIENVHKHVNTIQSAPIINGRHTLNPLFAFHLTNSVDSSVLYPTDNTYRDPITFLIY